MTDPLKRITSKKEYDFWKRKIKVLHPQKGDILIVPAEANFDFGVLSEALKLTGIIYALVVPQGNAELLSKDEAIRFANDILKKYDGSTKNS